MELEVQAHPAHDELQIENLLSERLMEGFVLLEKSCPVCATPLVKNEEEPKDEDNGGAIPEFPPTMVPSQSFDQPFSPVGGVPFCVACQSHVITQECEISILERCDSLKNKGSILVALQDGSTTYSDNSHKEEEQPEMGVPTIVEEKKSEEAKVIDVTHVEEEEAAHQKDLDAQQAEMEAHAQQAGIISPHHETEMVTHEQPEVIAVSSTASDKNSDKNDHADEKKEDEPFENQNTDEIMAEYSVRREIATKVLGAKMLQGYTLKETQCGKCGMPVMEYKGKMDCVVCPALVKKARKKLKAQQRLAEEAARLEQEMEARKAQEAAEERRRIEEATIAQRKAHELERAREQAEAERLQREHEERQRQMAEDEEARKRAHALRVAELEAEEARLLAEAAAREAEEARLTEEARAIEFAQAQTVEQTATEKALLLEQYRRENEARLLEEQQAMEEKRRLEEMKLMEETKRLEDIENRRKQHRITTTENMKADLLGQEYRTRLVEKAKMDADIAKLQEERLVEEMETRRLAEERQAREEALMIQTLEDDAAEKARAAEQAILKAKAALEHVSSARRDIIAQTIAMAEAEAVAEAEDVIKQEREDYKSPVILPTASDLQRESWVTLRTESRSVMTRRVMAGWTLLAELCVGIECEGAPLVSKGGQKQCVVCGGCGNGKDGAYAISKDELLHQSNQVADADEELATLRQHGVPEETLAASGVTVASVPSETVVTAPTLEDVQDDFETKRNMVSKEIGKRMMSGWTLLDASCPRCVMPLMMDDHGQTDICVLCGLVSNFENNDGSTIQTDKPSTVQTGSIEDGSTIQTEKTPKVQEETALRSVPTEMSSKIQEETDVESAVPTESAVPPAVESPPTMEEQQLQAASSAPEQAVIDVTKTKSEGSESEYLAGSIRRSSQRLAPVTPKGDPPAALKRTVARQGGLEPDDVIVSKQSSHLADEVEANRTGILSPQATVDAEPPATEEAVTLSIPKNFDLTDEQALRALVASASAASAQGTPVANVIADDDIPDDVSRLTKRADMYGTDDDETAIEVTKSGTIFTADDAMSSESIFKMFMLSPMGVEANESEGKMLQYDEVLDLVRVFSAMNFSEQVPDETLQQVAIDIVERSQEPTARVVQEAPKEAEEPQVIHLEDYPTPEPRSAKTFNFDSIVEEDNSHDDEPAAAPAPSPKKARPTPEAATPMRRKAGGSVARRTPRGTPPRPDGGTPRRLPPASPRSVPPRPPQATSPRRRAMGGGGFVVVGGPGDRDHDLRSVRSGVSRAESVASEALESILGRLEECKKSLTKPGIDLETQLQTADLMEKLASAAVAMRKLEDADI